MSSLDIAKEVFEIESAELVKVSEDLTNEFNTIIEKIYEGNGKLIISGMGKSGIIAKKIAATLASTGTPSFYLHPAEAYHGDLGMIQKNDTVMLISNSGETDEILKILPFLRKNKNLTISISKNECSTLALNTDHHLLIKVDKEACPLQLAPTSSTTATLVMGDAIAIALMNMRDFSEEEFAKYHPGGTLGKRLLTKVSNVMSVADLPLCHQDTMVNEIVHIISTGRKGIVLVTSDVDHLIGIITDGDLRRAFEKFGEKIFSISADKIMSRKPISVNRDTKLYEAEQIMKENKIKSIVVLEQSRIIGLLDIYDTK